MQNEENDNSYKYFVSKCTHLMCTRRVDQGISRDKWEPALWLYRWGVTIQKDTLIWFSADNFRPVRSITFTQLLIFRPNFSVADGYNKTVRVKENLQLKSIAKQFQVCGNHTHQYYSIPIFIDLDVWLNIVVNLKLKIK